MRESEDMNYTRIKKLPSIKDIIKQFPLSSESRKKIMQDRQEIRNILEGVDNRLLMIIGPCSAWPREAVFEYAKGYLP
jgi:3-deoxy-7-phosphoheptulonate synthase